MRTSRASRRCIQGVGRYARTVAVAAIRGGLAWGLGLGIGSTALFPDQVTGQVQPCDAGFLLQAMPGNPPPLAGRDVILIHGFVPSENPVIGSDPDGSERCAATQARDPLVDYFHATGDFADGAYWSAVVDSLQDRGVRVWSWRWPTYQYISEAASTLRQVLNTVPDFANTDLVLVGHSMGGLVALKFAVGTNNLDPRVVRLLTLGTPHNGTNFGQFQNPLSIEEVQPGSTFLANLETQRAAAFSDAITYVFAARTPEFSLDCSLWIIDRPFGDDDCLVSVESALDIDPGETVIPRRVTYLGGPFTPYTHRQINLNYLDGFPEDGQNGQPLLTAVQTLLVDDFRPEIAVGQGSVGLSPDGLPTVVEVRNLSVGTLQDLQREVLAGADSWLSAQLSSSTASTTGSADLTLQVNPASLQPGPHSATVRLTAFDAPPVDIQVSVSIPENAPTLSVSNGLPEAGSSFELSWTAVPGSAGYELEFADNAGFSNATLVDLPSFQTAYSHIIATAGATRFYRVKELTTGFSNTVPVTAVSPPTDLIATPAAVTGYGFVGGNVARPVVTLAVNGAATFTWSATAQIDNGPPNWLGFQITGGDEGENLTLRLNPSNMTQSGTYTGTVTVTSPQANGDATIPVQFVVASAGSSGIDIAIDTAWWSPGQEPFNPQNNDPRLNWRIRNVGTQGVDPSSFPGVIDRVFLTDQPGLTAADLGNNFSLRVANGGWNIMGDPPLNPGGTRIVVDEDSDLEPPSRGRWYYYIVADAGSLNDTPRGVIPEVEDADVSPTNNLYAFEMFFPRAPSLSLQPTSLALGVSTGSAAVETLDLSNGGDSVLTWSGSASHPAITLSQPSGAVAPLSTASVNVVVDGTQLAAGSYSESIAFTSNGGNLVFPITVDVVEPLTLTVGSPTGPATLVFDAMESVPDSVTVTLGGTGAGAAPWTAAVGSGSSVTLDTSGGNGTGVLRWTHGATALPPGTYVDTITVTANGAIGSPVRVIDTLVVVDSLRLVLGAASQRRTLFEGQSVVYPSESIVLSGIGADTTAWSVMARTGTWLTVGSATGTGSGVVDWAIDPTGLTPGTYVDTLDVLANGAIGSPAQFVDSLDIVRGMGLGRVSASDSVDLPNPPQVADSVLLTMTGPGSWAATSGGASWLTLDTPNGVGSGTIRWTLDPTGLAAGTYVDTIVVDAGAIVGSPATFVNTLVVRGQALPDIALTALDAPDSVETETGFVASVTGLNGGSAALPAGWELTLVLSADTLIDSADLAVGAATFPTPTDPGLGFATGVIGQIPDTTASGSYWLGVVADPNGVVTEADENNNTARDALIIWRPFTLAVSPSSRADTVQMGAVAPRPDSGVVALSGDGAETTAWLATHGSAGWLLLSDSTGTGSGVVRWIRNPAGLAPGTHVDTITVSSGGLQATLVDTLVVLTPAGLLFYEDFSSGLGQWTLAGSPLPFIDATDGNPSPSLYTNGDGNFQSGGSTVAEFAIGNDGLRLEWEMLRPALPIPTFFTDAFVGLGDRGAGTTSCCEYDVGIGYKPDIDGRFWFLENRGLTSSTYRVSERRWLDLRVDITPDGSAHYFVDDSLLFVSREAIALPGGNQPLTVSGMRHHLDNISLALLPNPGATASVFVFPDTAVTLQALGDTIRFRAAALDQSGTPGAGTPVGWASSNPAVATVTPTGAVTAIANGIATISATSDGVVGSAQVIVNAPGAPTLFVNPLHRTDTAVVGSAQPLPDSAHVTLTGTGAQNVAWWATVTPAASWITLSDSTGTGDGRILWSRDPSGLAAGIHVATIAVTAPGALESPRVITDSLVVSGPPLTLSVTPTTRADSVLEGSSVLSIDSASMGFSGVGASSAMWTAARSAAATWLTLIDSAGSGDGVLRWSRDPTGLGAGTYVATITIDAPGAAGSPASVVDSLVVAPRTVSLIVDPAFRADTLPANSTALRLDSAAVVLVGPGSQATAWMASVEPGAPWIALTDSAGVGDGVVRWERNPTGLAPGTYVASIRVGASGAVNSPGHVADTLVVVAEAVVLAVTPASRADTVTEGSTEMRPDSVWVTVSGTGAQSVPWSVMPDTLATWLQVIDSVGVGDGWLRWTRDPSGLAPGTWTTALGVSPSGAPGVAVSVFDTIVVRERVRVLLDRDHALDSVPIGIERGSADSVGLTVTGHGSQSVTWLVTATEPWIELATTSGSGSGVVRWSRNAVGLSEGRSSGRIEVRLVGDTTVIAALVDEIEVTAPPVAVAVVIESILNGTQLALSDQVYLDEIGNRDGVFNVGDLLALLNLLGLVESPPTLVRPPPIAHPGSLPPPPGSGSR